MTAEMERVCALYAYRRIQTPVFEDAQLFSRTSGVGSDIVQKEMYYLADQTGESPRRVRAQMEKEDLLETLAAQLERRGIWLDAGIVDPSDVHAKRTWRTMPRIFAGT